MENRQVEAADRIFEVIPEDLKPAAKIVDRDLGPVMVVPTPAGVSLELAVGAVADVPAFQGRDAVGDLSHLFSGSVALGSTVPLEGPSAPDQPKEAMKALFEEYRARVPLPLDEERSMPQTIRRVFLFEEGDRAPWFACHLEGAPSPVFILGGPTMITVDSIQAARDKAREERGDFEEVTFESFQILYKARLEADLAFIREKLPADLIAVMRAHEDGLFTVLIFDPPGAAPVSIRPDVLRGMMNIGAEDAAEVLRRLVGLAPAPTMEAIFPVPVKVPAKEGA